MEYRKRQSKNEHHWPTLYVLIVLERTNSREHNPRLRDYALLRSLRQYYENHALLSEMQIALGQFEKNVEILASREIPWNTHTHACAYIFTHTRSLQRKIWHRQKMQTASVLSSVCMDTWTHTQLWQELDRTYTNVRIYAHCMRRVSNAVIITGLLSCS